MKKFLSLLLIALMMLTVLFVSISCKEDQPEPEPQPQVTQYTVSFVNNGGTPKLDPVTVNADATISKTKKTVEKEGYTLLGWYTDSTFKEGTEFVFKKTKVNSDLTLYAKWVDTTTYEHSDPILPKGSVALNSNSFTIPLTWSADAKGWTAANGKTDLPAVTYSFDGERTNKTNVSTELKAAMAAATADPTFFDETPKNIIFLFSDGWGVTEVNMSREYKGELIMDSLPYATESYTDSYKQYSFSSSGNNSTNTDYSSHTTTDSCAGGTQVLAGYKTRYGYIALDVDGNPVKNLIEAAHDVGWKTAVVTNDNIVDATPAVAMIHDTNRYHSDVLYYKALRYALVEQGLDLLMGWDWGMNSFFKSGSWAARIESAEIEGIKDAVSRQKITGYDGSKPIEYFKKLSTDEKYKMATFSVYYAIYENEVASRYNSYRDWPTNAAKLTDYLNWLEDKSPYTTSGLSAAIANLDTVLGADTTALNAKVKRFTDMSSLMKNTDLSKPILASWLNDTNNYESSAPNRGYLLNGNAGKMYPSWPEMVAYTIYQLDKEANEAETGFFCLIENTCTDGWGHSEVDATKVYGMMNEVQCFDEGVAIAIKYVLEHPDTLLVVSADHETGAFKLSKGWETDFTKCESTDTGHSSQRVPLYAFGAGAQNFSAEAINTKYGSDPRASVSESGKVHEGWITGALMGELMTGEAFGQTGKSTYKGQAYTNSGTFRYGNALWDPADPVWTPAAAE
ncbi:MAG: alkaline phosphatase [Spirochaetales bacterium]|nr:alkaline phosphatase [Spirochaetales bacterium]